MKSVIVALFIVSGLSLSSLIFDLSLGDKLPLSYAACLKSVKDDSITLGWRTPLWRLPVVHSFFIISLSPDIVRIFPDTKLSVREVGGKIWCLRVGATGTMYLLKKEETGQKGKNDLVDWPPLGIAFSYVF